MLIVLFSVKGYIMFDLTYKVPIGIEYNHSYMLGTYLSTANYNKASEKRNGQSSYEVIARFDVK